MKARLTDASCASSFSVAQGTCVAFFTDAKQPYTPTQHSGNTQQNRDKQRQDRSTPIATSARNGTPRPDILLTFAAEECGNWQDTGVGEGEGLLNSGGALLQLQSGTGVLLQPPSGAHESNVNNGPCYKGTMNSLVAFSICLSVLMDKWTLKCHLSKQVPSEDDFAGDFLMVRLGRPVSPTKNQSRLWTGSNLPPAARSLIVQTLIIPECYHGHQNRRGFPKSLSSPFHHRTA
ncbi:hypothetical protein J6590_065460 [Homalodisca vitripennis]|nr:hypothetical protein J6590_065460 [Homalodisca vitripennis]